MESIESQGSTVQEAVESGMRELGVTSPSQVMVEVVQEPDKGVMGEGARPAIVRLLYMGARDSNQGTSIIANPSAAAPPQGVTQIVANPYDPSQDEQIADEDEDEQADTNRVPVSVEDASENAQVARTVLIELLGNMEFDVDVEILRADSTRKGESVHWILNITGDQINRLIGHRGETLSSLQYITRLIVSRRIQKRANIIVDAGNYKAKRSDRLRRLANRMAEQALRQRRTVMLEPMPPHERRIIHLTLRKRDDVTTKSVGDGDKRKVTISPK
ncbi:MAG: RNA-binding cell elongation regulator Jag/EloR [Chloroflexota bacterium]